MGTPTWGTHVEFFASLQGELMRKNLNRDSIERNEVSTGLVLDKIESEDILKLQDDRC